jgi:hypothetical protein
MNNKQRREIIENAKASGYDGSYVDLFRDPAASLKLAVTQEERMKGLKPYNEPGGQAMALPNNPPNNPVNTIGTRPPIKTKSVGSKVGSAPVAPGISSFKGVVTAGDLRARGKYGRRRAEEGEPREAVARPEFAPTENIDGSWSSVPVEGTPVKDYLDRAQIALGAGSLAAAATGVGEVISVPADLINAAISFGRSGYYALSGDGANAAKYAGLGGLNVAAAIPVIGNAAGVASIAKTAKALGETKVVAKTAHAMHHGGEAAITAAKTADYVDLGDKTVQAMDSVPAGTFRGPKFKSGGYTNKFGRIKRSVGGSSDPLEGYTPPPPGEEPGTMANKWDAVRAGQQVMGDFFTGKRKGSIDKAREEARNDTMSYAVANYMTEMMDPETGQFRNESDPRAAMYINKMFADVGEPDLNSVDAPWSAATVTHFARQIDPEFQGSPLHADYINKAYKSEGNYKTKKLKWEDDYEVGDILYRGRGDTKGWGYQDFKKASKRGERYSSHSDIIVGTGVDENGRKYYEVLGGNMGGEKDSDGNWVDGTQTTKMKRMYPDNIKANYKGAMVSSKKKVKEERKEAKKVVQQREEAKKTQAPKNAPAPPEEDIELNLQEFDPRGEEDKFLQPSDSGYKAVTRRKVRSKLGRRLKDRRRKARKRK